MAFRASHRFARISARKVRPLADMVRGKYADEALDLLRYQPQRGARLLEKVIRSALGSAQDPTRTAAKSVAVEGLLVAEARSTTDRCSSAFGRGLAAWRS
jgi:large subunit ribosomal protein L22